MFLVFASSLIPSARFSGVFEVVIFLGRVQIFRLLAGLNEVWQNYGNQLEFFRIQPDWTGVIFLSQAIFLESSQDFS